MKKNIEAKIILKSEQIEALEEMDDEEIQLAIRFQIVIDPKQEPMRIDKFIMNRIENVSRSKIQKAIDDHLVLVNNQPIKANYKIKPGDDILVYEGRSPEYLEIIPEQMDLNIQYEDDDIMIINKPAGIVVHPGSGNHSGTLINGISWYLSQGSEYVDPELPRIGLVHRIDKGTSGILLIAKTEEAMKHLADQFKARTVHRRYIGLAWGNIEQDEGQIIAHIGRHPRHRMKMETFPDGEHGKHAITNYKVLERFHYVTLLEFRLETGRTHQIRVHAKYLGHTLFGDQTYGGNQVLKGTVHAKYKQFVENNFKIMPRQALHAKELGFIHPRTKEKMLFVSDLPDDFQTVIDRWRNYLKQFTK